MSVAHQNCSPYQSCSRDDPEDCRLCGKLLAGDNDRGVCYQCQRRIAHPKVQPQFDEVGHEYYCEKHKYNPPPHSGLSFCPFCEFPEVREAADGEGGVTKMICETCEFLQHLNDKWGVCLKSPPDKCDIALSLPEVNCPIGRSAGHPSDPEGEIGQALEIHCWAGKQDQYEIGTDKWAEAIVHGATCLLPDGHDGPHEWTSDDDFVIEFAKKEA